ncbi:Mce-associated membrane protein [Rhodococcus triatomae]|uniref:Mce-associated membrane protein n=1 Tax=Rhodococcus triatomae TaxID=300028 RepID=A0A1G7ZSM8_9NOCA|nr:hypothetical protein [Rhodococcus triatomae]SDH11678.1 Mce-associated membrane protein [Rhodococcus triatomae]
MTVDTDAQADGTPDTDENGAAETPSPGRPSGRIRLLAFAAVVALVAGLAGAVGYLLWDRSSLDDARGSALDAGRRYATDLATYSWDSLDRNLSVVRENSAGDFAEQYEEVATSLSEMIRQYQGTSSGEIVEAGLVSGDRDRAEVIVFLDQTVTNTNSPEPRIDRNRMQLSLIREGDQWKLTDVQLL